VATIKPEQMCASCRLSTRLYDEAELIYRDPMRAPGNETIQ
jgi:hypothetical protein